MAASGFQKEGTGLQPSPVGSSTQALSMRKGNLGGLEEGLHKSCKDHVQAERRQGTRDRGAGEGGQSLGHRKHFWAKAQTQKRAKKAAAKLSWTLPLLSLDTLLSLAKSLRCRKPGARADFRMHQSLLHRCNMCYRVKMWRLM